MNKLRIGLILLLLMLTGCSSFQKDWEVAKTIDTSSQYQSFLDQYGNKDHPHIEQARTRQAYLQGLYDKLSSLSVGMSLKQVREIIEVSELKPIYPSWLENLEEAVNLSRDYGMKLDYTLSVCNTKDLRELKTVKKIQDDCSMLKITSFEQADSVIQDAKKDVMFKSTDRDYRLTFDSKMKFVKWESKLNFNIR